MGVTLRVDEPEPLIVPEGDEVGEDVRLAVSDEVGVTTWLCVVV